MPLYLDRATAEQAAEFIWVDAQQEIRSCMVRRGFDYEPVPFQRTSVRPGVGGEDLALDAWTRAYGFGISTTLLQDDLLDASGLVGNGPPPDDDNPNARRLREMLAPQRSAWDQALYGQLPDPSVLDSPGLSDVDRDRLAEQLVGEAQNQPDSCVRRSVHGSATRTAFINEHQTMLDELEVRVETDARLVAAEDSVAACMSEAGYQRPVSDLVADIEEASQQIFDRYRQESFELLIGIETRSARELSPADIDDLVSNGDLDPSEEVIRSLAMLQDQETTLAIALMDCGGLGDLDALRDSVRRDLEADFVEEFGL